MVSRDTQVHTAAVVLAVLVLALFTSVAPDSGPLALVAAVLFYAIVLGGAHFYLAVRGEDGIVPVASRWRYLGMLAALFVGAGIAVVGGGRTVASVGLGRLGTAVVVGALVVYLVLEGVAGYRATESEPTG